MGKQWKRWQTIFLGSEITVNSDCSHETKRRLLVGRKAMTNLESISKKQRHYFADKGPYIKACMYGCSHVWMWELVHKEGCVPKNWCFPTVVLEKTFESPLDYKEIKPANPKRRQPWNSLEGPMLKLQLQYFGHLMLRSHLIGRDPDAGKDWKQEKKGTTEDETVGWHHELNGHGFG